MGFKPIEVTHSRTKDGVSVTPGGIKDGVPSTLSFRFGIDVIKQTKFEPECFIQPFWDEEERLLLFTTPDSREQASHPSVRSLSRSSKTSSTLKASWPFQRGLWFFPTIIKTHPLTIKEMSPGRIVLRVPKSFQPNTTP